MDRRDEKFFGDCRVFVRRLAGRTFSSDEAEDITQEVMLRLVRHLPHLDLDQPIQPWLATVTRTVGINGRRARRDVLVPHDTLAGWLDAGPDLAALTAERAERLRFLRAAFRRLSRADAELLAQHEFAGLSLVDIAQAEGVEPVTVRKRLSRARRRLGGHYVALGGPRAVAWPALPLAAVRRLGRARGRLRHRPRRFRFVLPGVAFAVVVTTGVVDPDQRLIPLPTPVRPPVPPVAADSGSGRLARTAAAVAPTRQDDLAVRRGPVQLSWRRVDDEAPTQPPARRDTAIVYDEEHDEYVLFGGLNLTHDGLSKTELHDTWTSPDGITWTEHETPVALRRRSGATMFYDATLRRVTLSGGRLGGIQVADGRMPTPTDAERSWVWDGERWTVLPQSEQAGAKVTLIDSAAFAYDRARQVAVQFGGSCDCTPRVRRDTRIWSDNEWRTVVPRHRPPGRDAGAMAYDAAREQVVLFGGSDAAGRVLGDTWIWDGTDWRQATPRHSPAAREQAALVDTKLGPVLIGGYDGQRNVRDAWRWTGTDWVPLAVDRLPPAVSGAAVAYHLERAEVVFFSGDLAAKSRATARNPRKLDLQLSEAIFVATVAGEVGPAAPPAPASPVRPVVGTPALPRVRPTEAAGAVLPGGLP